MLVTYHYFKCSFSYYFTSVTRYKQLVAAGTRHQLPNVKGVVKWKIAGLSSTFYVVVYKDFEPEV